MPAEIAPVLEATWETDVLDTGAIQDELNRLWTELGGPPRGGEAPGEMIAEHHFGGGGLMRANTLNLLAVADNADLTEEVRETIRHLQDFLPSRTIIIQNQLSPERDGQRATPYLVRAELAEQVHGTDESPRLRFETITIEAPNADSGTLASLVSPLLVAELPDFLWWPSGSFPTDPLFSDLVDIVDRLIVDSARLGRDPHGMTRLLDLVEAEHAGARVGDFTWLRLAPWRSLIAQFFDAPSIQGALDEIDQITVSYADQRSAGGSGIASALLLVGWLGSRLGWDLLDPLTRQKTGGWWAPLRVPARNGRRGRDVELRLISDPSPYARFSLRKVVIETVGANEGHFLVERTDSDDLVTSSQTGDRPQVSRMVYSRRATGVEMLGTELQRFSRDRVYEEALAFAVKLLTR